MVKSSIFAPAPRAKPSKALVGATVFHGIRYGRAFFHDFLIGLNGFDVFDLNGQAARRGVGGKFGSAVNQLRFFQAFGNRSGEVVA